MQPEWRELFMQWSILIKREFESKRYISEIVSIKGKLETEDNPGLLVSAICYKAVDT